MRVAIVGTGNIGSDLLEKLRRSPALEIAMFAGIDPDSPGLARGLRRLEFLPSRDRRDLLEKIIVGERALVEGVVSLGSMR